MQKAWDNPNNTQIVMAWIALVAVLTATYFLWTASQPDRVEAQGAFTIQVESTTIILGETNLVPITLINSPKGVSGFDISVSLDSGPFEDTVHITGADLGNLMVLDPIFRLQPDRKLIHLFGADITGALAKPINPATPLTLLLLKLEGIVPGTATATVIVRIVDPNDNGPTLLPISVPSTITVTRPFPTITGQPGRAQDIDKDGMAEDLNANGRHDFQDIVIFFNNISAEEVTLNVSFFDFDNNSFIGFNDILAMFQILIR